MVDLYAGLRATQLDRQLRAEVKSLAIKHGDKCSEFLAGCDDVHVKKVDRSHMTHASEWFVYRFTLPSGDDIVWDVTDGWHSFLSKSTAMAAMAAWVESLLATQVMLEADY